MSLNMAALTQAALEARGLGMDAVQKAASGHLGLPLGCAELGMTPTMSGIQKKGSISLCNISRKANNILM